MGERGLSFALVLTKTDKLTKNKLAASKSAFEKALLENWEELPPAFITSAIDHTGKNELLDFIQSIILQE